MKSPDLQPITNTKPFQITVRPLAQRCTARTSAARQLTRSVVEHIHPRAEEPCSTSRREVLQYIPAAGCIALTSLVTQQRAAQAVQGLTAGRLPGMLCMLSPCSLSQLMLMVICTCGSCTAVDTFRYCARAFRHTGSVGSCCWSAGIQGLTRSPAAHACGVRAGLSAPDADGYCTYTRPEGKSGGHGVGWSEIPRYMGNLLGHQRGHSCGAHPHPVA